ncbi:aminoacyl--tRNA ligase-related protein [Halocatena marina]|uniref:aminoacyl--tRNA ligase-related protein n=1 Tax=Halocatena marina TaxID=2934937 RepID=UPI00200F1102|nr:aminoacyl--tRNA ligase-related protein [Halocatena marina]
MTEEGAMRRNNVLLATSRATNKQTAAQLAVRAGLIHRFGSGLYGFTPTGERVRQKIIHRITSEMESIGAQAISLPQLQYRSIWEQSGRWGRFEGEMFTLTNRDGQEMCLAPSHEEGIVSLVDGVVRSYEDLPLLLYQINTKHRDDHARNGLLRTKEFTMKDAYSLHADADSLDECYERVRAAYGRLFDSLGIEFVVVEAENSVMGGATSEEFVAPVETGTGELLSCASEACRFGVTDEHPDWDVWNRDSSLKCECPECQSRLVRSDGIEIGHVFKLGARYSEAMGLTIDTATGSQSVIMGSYGIGVTRLIQTLIEQHADEDGCRWPVTDAGTVAPFEVAIIPLEYESDGEIRDTADRLHEDCGPQNTLLFDDPAQTIGERFAESDLLGIPQKIILGNTYRETGDVEMETREGQTQRVAPDAVSTIQLEGG